MKINEMSIVPKNYSGNLRPSKTILSLIYNKNKATNLDLDSIKNDLNNSIISEYNNYKLYCINKESFFLLDYNSKVKDLFAIGYLDIEYSNTKFKNLSTKKVSTVLYSEVSKEFIGKGFGTILYTLVYKFLQKSNTPLISDHILYKGSDRIWTKVMPKISKNFGIIYDNSYIPLINENEIKIANDKASLFDAFIAFDNSSLISNTLKYKLSDVK